MKTYVITYKSITYERWIVDAENKTEARELFRDGHARISNQSEIDVGAIQSVQVASAIDIENADALATCAGGES